jgi:hypothetical protein
LEAAARAPLGLDAGGKFPEEIADGREHALLLDADGRVAEAAGEFERIDAVVVDDAVEIDVADVAFFGELGLHFEERLIEEAVGVAPKHGSAHFAGGRADIAREKFFVLEVDIYRVDEFFAVEECADGDFNTGDPALELEHFDFVGKSSLISFEHSDDVVAVFFLADKEAALDVLGFAAGFDDVAVGILHHKFDGGIEGIEILIRDDVDAGFFQLFLAEGAIVFEAIRILRATDDRLPRGTESVGFGALAESVVEDDDVGPLGVTFPIFGFGDEAVGDVALFFGFDVVTDVVAFFENLPGDVTDESREGDKEKFAFIHLDEQAAGRGSSEARKYSSQNEPGHCYTSLKIIEVGERGEATRGGQELHHRGWGCLGSTCPLGQISCSTWPFVQVILGCSRRLRNVEMIRCELGQFPAGLAEDYGEEPDIRERGEVWAEL